MDGSLKSQAFFGAKFEDVCTQLMVSWWFGARWLGFRKDPLKEIGIPKPLGPKPPILPLVDSPADQKKKTTKWVFPKIGGTPPNHPF